MTDWVRKKPTSGVKKLVTYFNAESDPKIAQWLDSIPYGKSSEYVRKAIEFYIDRGLNSGVTSEKSSKMRRRAPAKHTLTDGSETLESPPIDQRTIDPTPKQSPDQSSALEKKVIDSSPFDEIESDGAGRLSRFHASQIDTVAPSPSVPNSGLHDSSTVPVPATIPPISSAPMHAIVPDESENAARLTDFDAETLKTLALFNNQFGT